MLWHGRLVRTCGRSHRSTSSAPCSCDNHRRDWGRHVMRRLEVIVRTMRGRPRGAETRHEGNDHGEIIFITNFRQPQNSGKFILN